MPVSLSWYTSTSSSSSNTATFVSCGDEEINNSFDIGNSSPWQEGREDQSRWEATLRPVLPLLSRWTHREINSGHSCSGPGVTMARTPHGAEGQLQSWA